MIEQKSLKLHIQEKLKDSQQTLHKKSRIKYSPQDSKLPFSLYYNRNPPYAIKRTQIYSQKQVTYYMLHFHTLKFQSETNQVSALNV